MDLRIKKSREKPLTLIKLIKKEGHDYHRYHFLWQIRNSRTSFHSSTDKSAFFYRAKRDGEISWRMEGGRGGQHRLDRAVSM